MNRVVVREFTTAVRLDFAEVLRSRWLPFMFLVYLCVGVAFVLVGLRESMVLGFSGSGRIMLGLTHGLLVLLPLLALSATAQVVGQARTSGMLEVLMTQPLRRWTFFVAVSCSRLLLLCVPLVALLLGIGLFAQVAFDQAIPWPRLVRATGVSIAVTFAFVGIGMAISTLVVDAGKSMIAVLLTWSAAVALLDFGLIGVLLSWRVEPHLVFLLAAVNPVESARLALLSGTDASLSTLGPVGIYLATRLGPTKLLVAGLVWPGLVGAMAWLLALRSFLRRDVV